MWRRSDPSQVPGRCSSQDLSVRNSSCPIRYQNHHWRKDCEALSFCIMGCRAITLEAQTGKGSHSQSCNSKWRNLVACRDYEPLTEGRDSLQANPGWDHNQTSRSKYDLFPHRRRFIQTDTNIKIHWLASGARSPKGLDWSWRSIKMYLFLPSRHWGDHLFIRNPLVSKKSKWC